MENTEAIFSGTWKDDNHRAAINAFFYEHIFARAWIPLVFFILTVFVSSGLMAINEWYLNPVFWAVTGVEWGAELIFIHVVLFYHRRYLACPKGTEYSVFVDKAKKEPILMLKTDSVTRSLFIRRVFVTQSFIYIGQSWCNYVVLPNNAILTKYFAENFLDKFNVPFRGCMGYPCSSRRIDGR